jgi:site-specific DNA-methyltransferase (cytosine-N4-specific)
VTAWEIRQGDALELLRAMPAGSADCAVTSPPYWSHRVYGTPGEIGGELTPELYVERLVGLMAELRRVLRPQGSCWLNLGDSYAASGKGGGGKVGRRRATTWAGTVTRKGYRMPPSGYKMKDLTLLPFQVAHAMRQDGWYLRATIVWSKPAAIEPPRRDRPCVSHEYVFLLAPSRHPAVADPGESWWGSSVWSIQVNQELTGHPAVMPFELARRCVAAGSRPGELVIDPFSGSGTVGVASLAMGRRFLGMEISGDNASLSRRRIAGPLFADAL